MQQPVAQPSARLYCWIHCFSSFSWKYPIDSRWGSGQACCLAVNIRVSKPLGSAFGTKVLLENEISISIKLVSRCKHKVLQNLIVDGWIDFGLDKTQWTNTSRHHSKMYFYLKRGLWTTEQKSRFFLLSPGKILLTMFLFQKWLGSSFPEDVWAWWLLMHWLQLQFTPCELSQVFESALLDSILKLASSLFLVHIFLPNFFLPVNFAFNMLWYSTPWTASPFSNAPLWLTLFVKGVNDRLLDHYQVSSVPHYCAFKEQEIPWIYTVLMVIYWNSNVNILIFWDTDFWLSLSVSFNHQN